MVGAPKSGQVIPTKLMVTTALRLITKLPLNLHCFPLYVYTVKHNIGHHPYTNMKQDPDTLNTDKVTIHYLTHHFG